MEEFRFDYAGYLQNMAFLLVLLVGLSIALVKLKGSNALPKLPFLSLPSLSQPSTKHIQIVERTALEPRKSIYLIQVFDQHWLIGVSDNQIQALGKVEQAPSASEFQNDGEKNAFADYLSTSDPPQG